MCWLGLSIAQHLLDGRRNQRQVVAQPLHLSGWRSSVSMPLPIRLVVVSWPPTMVTIAVGDHFFLGQPVAVDLRGHQGVDQARRAGCAAVRGWRRGNTRSSARRCAGPRADAIGIVLEIAQHFGEIRGPVL